jgi:transposase
MRPLVNEAYDGKQFVGIDLHRRRSVVARMTETGDPLGWVQISNDRDQLALAMIEAGENAEVVLEATYGWYWAADLLAGLAANVHLAHPLGVKAFSYRRVKNDVRDATDLADLLRMGRLPEAWIAPPDIRDLRELVRHRAKLVHLRTSLRCQVHAVLAGQGVPVSVSDLFGVAGTKLLDEPALPKAYRYRVDSLRRLITVFDAEIDAAARLTRERLSKDPCYVAVQTIPGVGQILGSIFVAEIGEVSRFPGPGPTGQLGRVDPRASRVRHHRAPRPDHQTGQSAGPLGRSRGGATHHQGRPAPGAARPRRARRGRNIATVAAARELLEMVFYALRDHTVQRLTRPAVAA